MDATEFAAASAIATNLARHSRGVDRNDAALLASAYWPDATVAYGAAAEFVTFLTTNMAGAPVTLHRTSNILARVDGDGARSETYVIAYLREPRADRGTQRLIGGRYLDRHARRGREWRIAHRTYVMDWNMNAPAAEGAMPGAAQGAQGMSDASAAAFGSLRARGGGSGEGRVDELDAALAKQALHDLNATYARAVDRGDAELLATVFWPDSEVVTGVIDGPGPDYARQVVAMVREHLRSCFHSISNEYFEVAGDHAVGESYVVAHNITKGGSAQETLTGGRYLDRYERRDRRWRISRRQFLYDWSITRPATMELSGMYEHLPTRGGWSPDDPSVAFWTGA